MAHEQVFDWKNMFWFEEIWRNREEQIYPKLFGTLPATVLPLKKEALESILGKTILIKDEWLHFAVIEIEPNTQHADWLYVSSAFSQPWDVTEPEKLDRNAYSGFGYELVLRTPTRAGWAVDALHRLMAYQIGVRNELMRGKLFEYGDWMPLNGSINPALSTSKVRGILFTRPRDFEARFELSSGQVDLLQIVGITGDELAYGLHLGFGRLERLLYEKEAAPTTDPTRSSIELSQTFELPPQLATKF